MKLTSTYIRGGARLIALAIFMCVATFVFANWEGIAPPIQAPSQLEGPESHNRFDPHRRTAHRSDEHPYIATKEALTGLDERKTGVVFSTVFVYFDRSNLHTSFPVKVGLFDGLKLIDTCEIVGNSCLLSTQKSGTFFIAVDKTTLPEAYGVSSTKWAAETDWSGWTPFKEIEIKDGEEAQASLQLLPPGNLMVTTLSHEGLSLEGVLLSLRSVHFPAEHHTQSSNPTGVVAFNDLKVGTYILRAQALNSGEHSYRTTHVDVEPGITTNTQIQSEPTTATVSGTLISISGLPVVGASIQLKMGRETTKRATSGADGSFSFEGLQAGEFVIKASKQELPIIGNEPPLNIITSLRLPPLQLSIGDHIQLGDLAVQLKETPSITLHIIGADPLLYKELSVHQTNSTRGHKPTNPDTLYEHSGNQRIGSFRLRRPKAGKDHKVYIRHGQIFLGAVMIKSDSPAAIDFHL